MIETFGIFFAQIFIWNNVARNKENYKFSYAIRSYDN